MDTSSIIWAIVIVVIMWFITMVAGEMITRPKLTFEKDLNKRKWVFRLEKNKPAPYAYTGVSGITVTTQGSTSDYGVNEQMKLSGGAFFDFYGITIKNLDDPNVFIH